MKRLRKIVADYGAGTSESEIETVLRRLVRKARLPAPLYQFRIEEDGRSVARLDAAWPESMLGVEVDSSKWHGSRERWRRDLSRRNRLIAMGWRIIHLTYEDLVGEPDATMAMLRREIGMPPMFAL